MEIIERLRHRSEDAKRRYAFLAAVIATFIIGAGWSTSLPARYADVSTDLDKKPPSEASGIADIIDTVGSQLGSVGESIEASAVAEPEAVQDRYLEELSGPATVTDGEPNVPIVSPPSPSAIETPVVVPMEPVPVVEPQPGIPAPEVVPATPAPVVPPNIILKPTPQPTDVSTEYILNP